MYIPSPRGDPKKWFEKLTEILSRKDNFKKKEIWFNIDYLKRGDINVKRFIAFFKAFGLSQFITDITRPSIGSSSCIDWIVTNCRFVKSACVLNIYPSDHFAIKCIRKKARECNQIIHRKVHNFDNYNRDVFINFVRVLSNSEFETSNNPNDKWKIFYDRLEAKSEKGPRNHFRGDGMLEDVTHASSPD